MRPPALFILACLLFVNFLVFAADHVAMPIAHFIPLKVRNLAGTLSRFGFVAAVRPRTVIAMIRMEMVIHVAMEVRRAMKPWAGANEDAVYKPLRPVVAVGSAIIGRNVVVAVGANRRNSDFDTYLGMHSGNRDDEADSGNNSECKNLKSVHSHYPLNLSA